ncbi:uncharacterized protein BDV17DRAFT_292355 [Aspergillus undulatus]|uniref:uncharacterized protein n=1 Tax=Aspergillus undulatus TaxID=1810928 RepID=UPI003CCD11A3
MAGATHNHTNHLPRLDFVQRLLHTHFLLQENTAIAITPTPYDPECPFKYNNFCVPRLAPLTPDHSATANESRNLRPGCVAIPPGTQDFIIRLANPDAEGMNPATRVEK